MAMDVGYDENGHRVSRLNAQRDLRRRLVRARRRRFETRADAAAGLGWTKRRQDTLETGETHVRAEDLDVIFATLAVDEGERPEWERLVTQASFRGWWDALVDAELSPAGKQWAAWEWGARRLRVGAAGIIPVLLQTDGYAEAVVTDIESAAPEQVRNHLANLERRRAVLDDPDPVDYHAIIDEAAIVRSVGTGVMKDQVAYLLDLAARQHITIQVVPFTAGLYPAMTTYFTLVDTGIEGDHGRVLNEATLGRGGYSDDLDDISRFSAAFRNLADRVAPHPSRAVDILKDAHDVHKAQGDSDDR